MGVLAGGEFRERDYKECDPVGKKWLEGLLAQRGMEAHTLAGEAFKDGDVEFYPASGKRETADAEVRKDGYIWAKRADGQDRACEGEVPNPSLYSLLGILNFPLEAL